MLFNIIDAMQHYIMIIFDIYTWPFSNRPLQSTNAQCESVSIYNLIYASGMKIMQSS